MDTCGDRLQQRNIHFDGGARIHGLPPGTAPGEPVTFEQRSTYVGSFTVDLAADLLTRVRTPFEAGRVEFHMSHRSHTSIGYATATPAGIRHLVTATRRGVSRTATTGAILLHDGTPAGRSICGRVVAFDDLGFTLAWTGQARGVIRVSILAHRR
jgi:hypothetical protein